MNWEENLLILWLAKEHQMGNSEEAQSGLAGVRGAFGPGGPGLAPRFISYVTWSRLLGLF